MFPKELTDIDHFTLDYGVNYQIDKEKIIDCVANKGKLDDLYESNCILPEIDIEQEIEEARAWKKTQDAIDDKSGLCVVETSIKEYGATDVMDSLPDRTKVANNTIRPVLPVYTTDHIAKLLVEPHLFTARNGVIDCEARMCINAVIGNRMCKAGLLCNQEGIVLRELLSPEELNLLEETGENPKDRRQCFICEIYEVMTARIKNEKNKRKRWGKHIVIPRFCNLVDVPGGYKASACMLNDRGLQSEITNPLVILNASYFTIIEDPFSPGIYRIDQSKILYEAKDIEPINDLEKRPIRYIHFVGDKGVIRYTNPLPAVQNFH